MWAWRSISLLGHCSRLCSANLSFAQCSNCLCRRLCQCCRTGTLALNRYGWVGVGICRCWAVTLHVPGIPSRMKVALGRRHRHYCTPVFLWVMLYQAYVLFSFMEHRECPELAAAAGCRCGMGSIPLLCPALPHLLCTRNLAVLTQPGLPWWLWHGASLCQHQCTRGQRVQEHSSQQLRAGSCAPVCCSTGLPECSLRGDVNKSHYSSLKKRSQIFLKRKKSHFWPLLKHELPHVSC